MKKNAWFLINLFIIGALSFSAYAKPAKKGIFQKETSDGTVLNVRLIGDEFYHQYYSEDGYPLLEKDGDFYYCDYDESGNLIDSGIKATNIDRRSAAAVRFVNGVDRSVLDTRIALRASKNPRRIKSAETASGHFKAMRENDSEVEGVPYEKGYGLFADSKFPSYGRQKAIAILVEYTDTKFNTSYDAHDYFTRLLNEEGFNDYGATGCASQYFKENSQGIFIPEFDVFGPITLPHNRAYYGSNNYYGDDLRPAEMVVDACNILDDEIDFSEYDRDGNGIVDNIYIFYAGMGEASGGPSSSVWPHSWDLRSAGFPNVYHDGVQILTYACSNEWETSYTNRNGRPDGIGTFIHEFSHVMGLPDLYATTYTSAFTPGEWSVLDYGPYNNDSMTPPNYGAFERYALGWVKPREIDRAISATLEPVSENACGIIRTDKSTEFFLLENRQQNGWDAYIPGHGMLIWHIDYNSQVWRSNSVNNTSGHQYVDIEEADNIQSGETIAGDAFPGTSNITSFTSNTKPSMKTWSSKSINLPITEIKEENGLITFNVLGGAEVDIDPIEAFEADEVTESSFRLNWEKPADGNMAVINVYSRSDEGLIEYVPGYRNRIIEDAVACMVKGVESEQTYYFTVAQTDGWNTSLPSAEKMVTTPDLSFARLTVTALEAEEIGEDYFVAAWTPLTSATGYELTVYMKKTDISVDEDSDSVVEYLDGYEAREVGDISTFRVDGLVPDIHYYYMVRATNGEMWTSPSNEIMVTLIKSGIKPVISRNDRINIDGRDVYSDDDVLIYVYNAFGMKLAEGIRKITLPSDGLYIITVPERNIVIKTYVK